MPGNPIISDLARLRLVVASLGELEEAVSARGVEEMAKHYLSAFQRDAITLPYFAASRR